MQIGSAFSRRRLLLSSGAALLAGTATAAGIGLTPSGAEGPFYPYGNLKPPDHDWDLANYAGHSSVVGKLIYIEGRVLSAGGSPVANATVEIWQANAEGNYNHPDVYRADDFQGFGAITTQTDGRYRFRTIMPGAYGIALFRRTPHIHFKVRSNGNSEFITQMYFAEEALNQQDSQFRGVGDATAKARVQTTLKPAENIERGARAGKFDLIIET